VIGFLSLKRAKIGENTKCIETIRVAVAAHEASVFGARAQALSGFSNPA
jgi:hypothetical protein